MTDNYESFDSANDVDAPPVEPPKSEEKPEVKTEGDKKVEDKADEDAKSWQSKADKAEARANKAEQELDQLRRSQTVEEPKSAPPAQANGSGDAWVAASKDNFRDDLFRSDPRLANLGFEPALIQGSTPAEMRQSFTSLQGTVNRMESGIRNQVLVEHGLEPVPGSGERATAVNFKTMPTDEFNKIVDKALQG